jgi:casein kinase II subunit beta
MLPSKSPTSQSPFLLSQTSRAHDSLGAGGGSGNGGGVGGMQAGLLEGEDGESPTTALSPNLNTSGGVGGVGGGSGQGLPSGLSGGGAGQGPAAAPGGSTATAASKVERYRPRIFGFPTHETAKLHRWQERQRDAQVQRLEQAEQGVPVGTDPDAGE